MMITRAMAKDRYFIFVLLRLVVLTVSRGYTIYSMF